MTETRQSSRPIVMPKVAFLARQKEAKASNSKRNTGLNEDKGGLFHRLNRT
jgi:hypothetical protein